MTEQELKMKIARAFCCFAEENESCIECKYNTSSTPFPDCFCDIRTKIDHILAIFPEWAKVNGYVKLPPDSAILENISLLKDIGKES